MPMMVVDGVGMVWASIRKEDQRASRDGRMLGNYIGPGSSPYTDYDTAVTDKTVEWLATRGKTIDRPWCLYVGLVAPHFPLVVPQAYYDLYPLHSLPQVKQHPDTGYQQHPWIQKQNAFMDSESQFKDEEERLSAIASYYGLCSWMDSNVGKIVASLQQSGLTDTTTIVYTSDHGDNVGARGLWGKSNLYEEACAIPLIMAGPGITPATCDAPVSLVDLSVTIASHFDTDIAADPQHGPVQGQDLHSIAQRYTEDTVDSDRLVFSEYHAAGSVSGAFMIRKGPWKYIHYVGFEPELFNLLSDPEELHNVAAEAGHAKILRQLHDLLLEVCDPEAMDQLAHRDQAALIETFGGAEKALQLGAPGATPPPKANA